MSQFFQIEDGVPVPEITGHGCPKSPMRVALEKLQVGQSFVAPREQKLESVLKMAKRVGVKVATRQVNCEGRRIWRIK